MGIESIYSCKLYKSSTRKEKIQSAINDPVNVELVEQISSYLDEDSLPAPKSPKKATDKQTKPHAEESATRDDSFEEGRGSSSSLERRPNRTPSPRPSRSEKPDMEDIDRGDAPMNDPSEDVPRDVTDPEDEIQESVKIEASSNVCASDIDLEALQGSLNLDNETSGVTRIRLAENEVWIHYADNVNLNNIMIPAINKIESLGYYYLEFNRLARTENAIVMQVNESATVNVNEEEGEE